MRQWTKHLNPTRHELSASDVLALIVIVGVTVWAGLRIVLLYGGLSF